MTHEEKIQLIEQLSPIHVVQVLRARHREIYDEIYKLYPQLDEYPFKQKIYWYINGLDGFTKCLGCGKDIIRKVRSLKEGPPKFCSLKCSNNSSKVKEKKKNTSNDHYGVDNPFQSVEVQKKHQQTCIERYGVPYTAQIEGMQEKIKQSCLLKYGVESTNQLESTQEKKKQTCLRKYGVECTLQDKQLIEQRKQTCLKKYGVEYAAAVPELIIQRKQTCLKKYGFSNPSGSSEIKEKKKQTCMEHYGVEYPNQSILIQEKVYTTKKQNNTFNISKHENKIYLKLVLKYPDASTQHKSEKYPFNCDFYIPSTDTYIELHFNWTHGYEPYTGTTEHQNKVKLWECKSKELNFKGNFKIFYNKAIYVWTISDPKKAQWAKDHNLKWLCFYNEKQFNEWYNSIA